MQFAKARCSEALSINARARRLRHSSTFACAIWLRPKCEDWICDWIRSLKTRFGRFNLGLDGGYIFRFDQAVSNTSPMVNIVDTVGNPLSLRMRGTAEWYQRDWDQPGFGVSSGAGSHRRV